MQPDWEKVAKYLDDEGSRLRSRADFIGDGQAQSEMRTRASIFIIFAEALSVGLRGNNTDAR